MCHSPILIHEYSRTERIPGIMNLGETFQEHDSGARKSYHLPGVPEEVSSNRGIRLGGEQNAKRRDLCFARHVGYDE